MKLLVVVALLAGLVVARRLYLGWKAGLHQEDREHPRVPPALLDGADRTWVVFTTPYCAACGPVKERLADADPNARVVTVDATRDPGLAEAFYVRSAPTVLLADAAGEVRARLVGALAVSDYLASV
ncbi:MAG TPA: thioredoxin family protein [Acidimicrobiales bacterium]|nr:thioredoxin family protein [Acidimicrobiales bacterium]